MSAAFILTSKSTNVKTGAMPVTTSPKSTCPDCPLKERCYGDDSYLGAIWRKLSAADAGDLIPNGRSQIQTLTFGQLVEQIETFEDGTMWRHNQAGDLPGEGNKINRAQLRQLTRANRGKRGFTYSHKHGSAENLAAIAEANANGFTINLSANNLAHADQLAETGAGPVVTLMTSDTPKAHAVYHTPAGPQGHSMPKASR